MSREASIEILAQVNDARIRLMAAENASKAQVARATSAYPG